MQKKDVFAILPYLKTSKPVAFRGILFRNNDDLEGLSAEHQTHLKTLFAMFFLRNDLRITHMMYVHFRLEEDPEVNRKWMNQLYEAQSLMTYLYSAPHSTMGDPSIPLEQSSMYVFQEDRVYAGLIWPSESDIRLDTGVENLAHDEPSSDTNIEGYYVLLNGMSYFWVVPGNRIYPPTFRLTLYPRQDLSLALDDFAQEAKNWAMVEFLEGYQPEHADFAERIFTALEWHNRSTAQDVNEEVALLNLAVAFESLLNLEQNDKVTDRFRETVMTLIGADPRLSSWLEQFYNARSSVAHKGKGHHLQFYAVDWDRNRLSNIYKGKDTTALQYRSLTMYGRRIFRLCLKAIISGARMAEEDGLPSLFVHNQERLEKICRQLGQTSEPAEKRLHSISKDVSELYEHWWASEHLVQSDTLIAAGKLVLQTYVEMNPKLSKEGETFIQKIFQQLQQKDVIPDEKLEQFVGLVGVLKQQNNSESSSSPFKDMQLFAIVENLLNYVTSPGFLTRKWYGQNSKKS